MATEWSISDGWPVYPADILRTTNHLVQQLLPGAFNLAAAMDAAERQRPSHFDGTFSEQIRADGPGFTTAVEISAMPMLGHDEQPVDDGTIYGMVTAHRTRTSAVLGLLVAVGWLSCSNGSEFTGTGLSRYYDAGDVETLIDTLRSATDLSTQEAIQQLSERILGSHASTSFS